MIILNLYYNIFLVQNNVFELHFKWVACAARSLYMCVQGNLCRLFLCYAFLRREMWTEKGSGRDRAEGRSRDIEEMQCFSQKATPESYVDHDYFIALFYHSQVADVETTTERNDQKVLSVLVHMEAQWSDSSCDAEYTLNLHTAQMQCTGSGRKQWSANLFLVVYEAPECWHCTYLLTHINKWVCF